MQGVVDRDMRELLTDIGGYDRCVTEFVRVTDQKFPNRVFYRSCPELHNGGFTRSGTPVYIQLLGGKAVWMAANAVKAAGLGAPGIDLNFGCPAKIVNRHDGGSVLLQEPQRVAAIVAAVRDAVDPAVPVTAKIRLGFRHTGFLEEIATRIAEAGADELSIHARTKEDGYKPPAYWHRIKPLVTKISIPVIVNGEIWSMQDAMQARIESGCTDVMLGRGALACPDLARQIKMHISGKDVDPMSWYQVLEFLHAFFENCDQWSSRYVGNRTKQWLSYLRLNYTGAESLFQEIKRLTRVEEINMVLERHKKIAMNSGNLECA